MGAASVLDPLASGFTKLDSGQRGVLNHATATPHRTVPHCEDEAEQDGGPINTRVGSQSFDDKQHEISTFYDELLRLERSVTNRCTKDQVAQCRTSHVQVLETIKLVSKYFSTC